MSATPEDLLGDSDAVIAEVREARRRISARFGHDPYKLVAYLMEQQNQHRDRLIPAPDAPPKPGSAAA